MSAGEVHGRQKNGKKKLQRHCEEVYTDQDETREVQEKRIEYFKKKSDRDSTNDGRGAEITVDLVLQARAKMSENKVNGPEDAAVSEMIKQLPLEKIYTVTTCFQERLMGQTEAPSSWKIVKLVFLRKPDADAGAIALTSVMSKWFSSCIILPFGARDGTKNWKKLHVGGLFGISCKHLQVMMANLPQKHWEWQEERTPFVEAYRAIMWFESCIILRLEREKRA